jgi:hypothetical protein
MTAVSVENKLAKASLPIANALLSAKASAKVNFSPVWAASSA